MEHSENPLDTTDPRVQTKMNVIHMEKHTDDTDVVMDKHHIESEFHDQGDNFQVHAKYTGDHEKTTIKTTSAPGKKDRIDQLIETVLQDEPNQTPIPAILDQIGALTKEKPSIPVVEETAPEPETKVDESSKPTEEPTNDKIPENPSLRHGTNLLFAAGRPKPTAENASPVSAIVGRIMKPLFAVMAIRSFIAQITVAFKWITIQPIISLFIIAKEFLGVIISGPALIQAFLERPTPRVFDDAIDPFNPRTGLLKTLKTTPAKAYMIQKFIYTLGCLSNLRDAMGLAVASRWNMALPLMAMETELQKIGNLMFLAIDLIIKVDNESKIVNFGLFASFLFNGFMVCLSLINRFALMNNVSDYLKDIDEGKVNKDQIAEGLAGMYNYHYGQLADDHFHDNAVGAQQNPRKEKTE